jgi:hypothetical protein
MSTLFSASAIRGRSAFVWLIVLAAVFGLAFQYVQLFKAALIDDTYITLQYARNLYEHGQWAFYPGQPTNTATSPLNVILIALVAFVAPDPEQAALWLAALELWLIFVFLSAISRKIYGGYYLAPAALLIIATNPLIISTIGLESILYVVLIVASLALLLYEKWIALAVVLALATMTRPDGGLWFIAMFFMVWWRVAKNPDGSAIHLLGMPIPRMLVLFGATYVVCLLPWELFSWFQFHTFLPDTFSIKRSQGAWGQKWAFGNGALKYLDAYPLPAMVSFAVIPFALFALFVKRQLANRLIAVLLAFGLLHFVGYSLLKVPPYHWYYVPDLAVCILVGSMGLASLFHGEKATSVDRILAVVIPIVFSANTVLFLKENNFAPAEVPIHTNWVAARSYKEIGLWVNEHVSPSERVKVDGEIGTVAYFARRQLLDVFSCRKDCGGHYDYYLTMYDRPVITRVAPVKRWATASTWAPASAVVLQTGEAMQAKP